MTEMAGDVPTADDHGADHQRPDDQLACLAKVAAGDYASVSEVVRAGLRALKERDAAVERWLRDEVAPAYDAIQADPSRALPAEPVFEGLRLRHAAKVKRRK